MTDTRLTDEELRRLEELAAKATPPDDPLPPLRVPLYESGDQVWQDDGDGIVDEFGRMEPEVATLIVEAVNALPRLLTEVQQLRQVREAAAGSEAAAWRSYATAPAGCAGDGLGEPSTCQTHMSEWHRRIPVCDAVLAARLRAALHPESQEEPR